MPNIAKLSRLKLFYMGQFLQKTLSMGDDTGGERGAHPPPRHTHFASPTTRSTAELERASNLVPPSFAGAGDETKGDSTQHTRATAGDGLRRKGRCCADVSRRWRPSPTCSLYACDADLGTCSAAASGASKTACAGTCVQNKQAYKEAGTCAINACVSSRLTTHTTARAHA